MARQGITREQVYEVADTLTDEGTAPTVQAVRERLGTGSYTTISAHLGDWRKDHAGEPPAEVPDMPERVIGAFRQVWRVAERAALEAIETERSGLDAARRQMDKEAAGMAAEIARLEQALEASEHRGDQLAGELEATRRNVAEAEKRATALTVENARIDERLKASEARGAELREQVEGLQGQLSGAAKKPKGRRVTPSTRVKKDAEERQGNV